MPRVHEELTTADIDFFNHFVSVPSAESIGREIARTIRGMMRLVVVCGVEEG